MIIDLPKLGPVRFRDDLTPEQFDAEVQRLSQKYDFKLPKPDIGLGQIAKRGFMRSLGETGIAMGDVIPAMVSSAFVHGGGDYAKEQMEEAAKSREELEAKYPTRFKSYKEVGGLGEGAEYVAETLGELTPTVATSLIPGVGLEAVGARLAAGSAARGIATKTAATRLATEEAAAKFGAQRNLGPEAIKALTDDATQIALKNEGLIGTAAQETVRAAAQSGGRKGMYGGVYLGSLAQNAPEVFENIYQETGKMEPGIAALAGGISAVLDSALPVQVLNGLGKYGKLKAIESVAKNTGAAPSVWKAIGKEAAQTAATEGLTETAQEAISVFAEQVAGSTKELFGKEYMDRFQESFVKGAIGGGAFGIPGGVYKGFVAKQDVKNTEEANKALAEQAAQEQEAGAVPPEKAAQYNAATEEARKAKEAELTGTFGQVSPSAFGNYEQIKSELAGLQSRMDEARVGSPAYAELDAAIKDRQDKINKMDAEKAKASAFTTAAPNEEGLFTPPEVERNIPKELGMSTQSKAAKTIMDLDLTTPEGVEQLVATVENPSFKGKIEETAYNNLLSTLDPQHVEAARTKLKEVPNAGQPVSQPSGTSPSVVSQPDTGTAPPTTGGTESDGVVPTEPNVGDALTGEGKPAAPITDAEYGEQTSAFFRSMTDREVEDFSNDTTMANAFRKAATLELQRRKELQPAPVEVKDETPPADIAPPPTPPAVPVEGRKTTTRKTVAPAPAKTVETPTLGKTAKDLEVERFAPDTTTVQTKLGKPSGLKGADKDANSYFGRLPTEEALKWLANDLVYQPTAYRNSSMKVFENHPEGPENYFSWEGEADMFRGQGGKHAENAEKWARANLSKTAVSRLDEWITQYTAEKRRTDAAEKRRAKRDAIKQASKEQEIDEAFTTDTAEKQALKDIEEDLGKKRKMPRTKKEKKDAAELARQALEEFGLDEDLGPLLDSDLDSLLASPEISALHSPAHPGVHKMLERGNIVGALRMLADAASSDFASDIAGKLQKYLKDVKVEYGAKQSSYDPKTNTIYLTDNATEYEVLHESSHAALSHVLANPSHPVTRQFMNLFEEAKKNLDGGAYGAKNVQEFAAEIWSNEDFRSQLKEMQTNKPKMSMWDKIMGAIRSFFGISPKQTSALDAADRMLNEIVSPPPETRSGETMYAQSVHNPSLAKDTLKIVEKVINKAPGMTPERSLNWLSNAESVGVTGRRTMRRFLNLSALGQVAEKIVGKEAVEFADKVNSMAGYYDNMMEKLQPLHKRLETYAQTDRYADWSRFVHETTRADVDPRVPTNTYVGSPEKLAAYNEFRNHYYNKLNGVERKLYDDTFKAYSVLFDELKDSLRSNLFTAFPNDKDRASSVYKKIIDQITAKGIQHYVPLYRRGDYFLTYKEKGSTEHTTELFDSEIRRDKARQELEAQGATAFEEVSKFSELKARNVPVGSVAGQIVKIMQDSGAGEAAVDQFLQLIVSAMPETSILKSFTVRKGTAGYINDVALAYSNVTSSTARQLSRMRYSEQLQGLVDTMRENGKKLRGTESTLATEFVEEFEARQKYAMNPTVADWARYASSGAFYFNLAGNVSSAVVNLLQTPMVAFPHLGGRYGFTETGKAMTAATKLYMSSGLTRTVTDINGEKVQEKAMLSIENLINTKDGAKYKDLIETLKAQGFLQTSTARDALEASRRPSSEEGGKRPLGERVASYSAFMFHHAERMNREVTAVAAYDLEMARSKDKTKAIEKAIRAVEFTHGAGHTESGPSIGHSDIGKVLTVFKRFGFSMYYMLFDTMRRAELQKLFSVSSEEAKIARRQLAGVYGMAGLFAGAKGLPMYWVAQMAYDAVHDDDEDDFDTMMRKYIGELAFKGPVNYFTNLGIADRVGWTDLIYRENKGGKADASALSQILESILGAPYAVVNSAFRAKELMDEGHYERAVEAMLPVALRNIFKGGRYAIEGANTLRGDPVMGDINGYNAAMQVMGFAPADLLRQYEINSYGKRLDEATVGKSKKLLKQYYIAQRAGDSDRADEVLEKLFDLSDKHNLGVSQDTINRSVSARDRISNEMYHGMQVNKKIRDEFEQSIADLED